MDAALSNALNAAVIRTFTAVRIELSSGYTINLIDGSGEVVFNVDGQPVTFDGADPVYGSLATTTSVEDKIASDAPNLTITLMPPSAAATGSLSNPTFQGSPVRMWFGLVNDATGAVVGIPELLWVGRLDFARTQVTANVQTVELETISAFDRLFVASEGARLNSQWHQSIWPGETGLDYNIDSLAEIYWGIKAPKPENAKAGTAMDRFKNNGFK